MAGASNFEFRLCFIDTFQKCERSNAPLALRFPMNLNFIKNAMSKSLQTYEKRGGVPLVDFQYCWGRANLFVIIFKQKQWFYNDPI